MLGALERARDGLSVNQLMKHLNVSRGRIDKALLLLSLESPAPIARQNTKWTLTAAELSESFWERTERLTTLRRTEQAQMQEYVCLKSGHMEFLIRALDGDADAFQSPDLEPLPTAPDPALVHEAMTFLRRTSLPLEPRKMWPAGGLPQLHVKGKITPEYRSQPGKVLCVWGDAGWGNTVRLGKYHERHFSDDLITACVESVRQWKPEARPTWVTCIPSRRHPDLVPDFARRLAAALGLPFRAILEKTDDRAEQKTMAKSVQQARNIDGSLAINTSSVPAEPVLLIDRPMTPRQALTSVMQCGGIK